MKFHSHRGRAALGIALALLLVAGAGGALRAGGDDDAKKPEGPAVEVEGLDAAALEPLLRRGELTLVESDDDGALRFVSVLALVDAPPEKVFAAVTDYDACASFMPRVTSAKVVGRRGQNEVEIELEIEAPGPNLRYTQRHTLDRERLAVDARIVSGDMEGGVARWRLRRHGEKTIVSYGQKAQMGGLGALLRSLDDRHHSLDYGINVSAAVLVLRAVKQRVEADAPAKDGEKGKRGDY